MIKVSFKLCNLFNDELCKCGSSRVPAIHSSHMHFFKMLGVCNIISLVHTCSVGGIGNPSQIRFCLRPPKIWILLWHYMLLSLVSHVELDIVFEFSCYHDSAVQIHWVWPSHVLHFCLCLPYLNSHCAIPVSNYRHFCFIYAIKCETMVVYLYLGFLSDQDVAWIIFPFSEKFKAEGIPQVRRSFCLL